MANPDPTFADLRDLPGTPEGPRDPAWFRLNSLLFTYMHDLGLFDWRGPWEDNFCIQGYRRGTLLSLTFRNSSMPWAASTCLDCNETNNVIYWSLTDAADLDDVHRRIVLQPMHLDRVARAEARGIRFLFFYVGWTWMLPRNRSVSHYTLLCVDTQRRTYGLYDPAGLQDRGDLVLKDGPHTLDFITLMRTRDRERAGPADRFPHVSPR